MDAPGWWLVAGITIDEEALTEITKIEETIQHDVAAFVSWLATKLPEEIGRSVHYGLTSSDIVDTALSLQMRKGLGHLRERLAKQDLPVHWINQATNEIGIGTISGPVGTYSSVPPEIEEKALFWLGLKPEPAPTQVVARDRHAYVMQALALTAGVIDRKRKQKSEEAIMLRTWAMVAVQNIGLWHERDISHSSTERVYLPESFKAMARLVG